MNYGQAIEAMKRGGCARRGEGNFIFIAHIATPLRYLCEDRVGELFPYIPTVDDQLAEDWLVYAPSWSSSHNTVSA